MHWERLIGDELFLSNYFREYVDVIPFLLSISFSGVVAAEPGDSKIINQGVFILAFCLLNCLTLVLLGNADGEMWMKHVHFGAILTSFKDINSFMSAVYSLMFFGEEAKHPKEDIPAAMIWSFMITWLWFALFPLLLLLNSKGVSLSSQRF
ncbi:hypothetical protein GE061_005060 [Apolygus lucorum]|uniref:Uncharacterized protein n=1 Tax=Apolygus lucorum TaxID=248454 RepID=A0A8S9WV90_APOLU|nr:hypothetical protein GE061_005060 [Apolygus lucorum]